MERRSARDLFQRKYGAVLQVDVEIHRATWPWIEHPDGFTCAFPDGHVAKIEHILSSRLVCLSERTQEFDFFLGELTPHGKTVHPIN